MPDLTPDHPAVLAALNAETQRQRTRVDAYADDHIREMLDALTAALLHLTADDLRHTPAGRALKAEGWDEGAGATNRAWGHAYDGHPADPDFPYHECQTCNTANPYLEGDA